MVAYWSIMGLEESRRKYISDCRVAESGKERQEEPWHNTYQQ
jgi:hypothetical protein